MISLVGYTGFVGGNIFASGKIDCGYNSKNIGAAYGTSPDLLIYAGLRAEKYLANSFPEKDMELILEAEKNIELIAPKKLVLISTVDVLSDPVDAYEDSAINESSLCAYGYNRRELEKWVRDKYPDALITRLPALFGYGLKKNFLYDMINTVPSMLNESKYRELSVKDELIAKCYKQEENGFYKLIADADTKGVLKKHFEEAGFTSLGFTDSRSVFQFYPLSRLWEDINTALTSSLTIMHTATEPVSAAEIYNYVTGRIFENELPKEPLKYDFKTRYAELFGGKDGYIMSKEVILRIIKDYYNKQLSIQSERIN